MLKLLYRNPRRAFITVIFGMFLGILFTNMMSNPYYAAARVTGSILEHIPLRTWSLDAVLELGAAATNSSLDPIDYLKPDYAYSAKTSSVTPGVIANK
jgi:hypothetical protein